MAFSTFNSIQSFLMYVRARVSDLAFTYNFPALDPSLVLYYPLDSSANVGGGFKTANFASKLPVYDASLAGSSMISYALGNTVTSFGDLSLNNTMGAQLVANTPGNNYVVSNTTFAPNISGGFSVSLWFSCSGQLNKTGTLISLPLNKINNGLQIDISGPNMIYSGWNSQVSLNILSGTSSFSVSNGGKNYYGFTTGTYTFTSSSSTINYLMIGGGGSGGSSHGGGGGAGQVTYGSTTITPGTSYTVTVGAGGAIPTGAVFTTANNGKNSTIAITSGGTVVTAYGGGYGGGDLTGSAYNQNSTANNGTMGSGGGGAGYNFNGYSKYGGGNTGTGNGAAITNGFSGGYANYYSIAGGGGGGGGAGQGGFASDDGNATGVNSNGGTGGNGTFNSTINTICSVISTNMNAIVTNWGPSITFSSNYYLGGGGGGGTWGQSSTTNTYCAPGGNGGGGKGGINNNGVPAIQPIAAITNTGGGGGGGGSGGQIGAAGGSGLVIIYG